MHDQRRGQPLNSVNREGLRRLELAAFGLLFLALCAVFLWRGVACLTGADDPTPLFGFRLPAAIRVAGGVLLLALSAGIAAATVAMVVRFRR